MARQKKAKEQENPQLEMTPMIDVVFQLLIFFIVTLKQEDIMSHLNVSRPSPDPNSTPEEQVDDLLTITIYNHKRLGGEGFSINGRKHSYNAMERQLIRLASFSKNISVIIKCADDSPHDNLVRCLNACAKAELKNLSVFSL